MICPFCKKTTDIPNVPILLFTEVKLEEDKAKYLQYNKIIFENSYFTKYNLNFNLIDDSADTNYYLISLDKNNDIGIFVYTFNKKDDITIDFIGIIPDYQGKGYGSRVLDVGIDLIKENGFSGKLTVEFTTDDTNLFNFYSKHGFKLENTLIYHYSKEIGNNFVGTPLEFNTFIKNNKIERFIPFTFFTRYV